MVSTRVGTWARDSVPAPGFTVLVAVVLTTCTLSDVPVIPVCVDVNALTTFEGWDVMSAVTGSKIAA